MPMYSWLKRWTSWLASASAFERVGEAFVHDPVSLHDLAVNNSFRCACTDSADTSELYPSASRGAEEFCPERFVDFTFPRGFGIQ